MEETGQDKGRHPDICIVDNGSHLAMDGDTTPGNDPAGDGNPLDEGGQPWPGTVGSSTGQIAADGHFKEATDAGFGQGWLQPKGDEESGDKMSQYPCQADNCSNPDDNGKKDDKASDQEEGID